MWLDVSPTMSVVVKDIVAVEAANDLNSIVHTRSGKFDVVMPKLTLMQMIESRLNGENNNVAVLLQEILKGQSQPRP